jgi:adenylate cyclase
VVEHRVERRLAAILALDMVGFSRLVEIDEAGTIARHKQYRSDVIEPKVKAFSGRVVKLLGDGLLAEFHSAVDAVQCAVELQAAINESEAERSEHNRISYRIGINLGDIIVDGDDIMGDGVNLAARVEPLADAGGISISRKLFDEVRNKTDLSFEDMGERKLKNIAEPVQVFRIAIPGTSVPQRDDAGTVIRSAVAVLPFANLSQDPEQQYFSDGLSEDIITLLSAWRSFPVIARNSSFAYRDRSLDIRSIAKELSARYVIEGSVRKSGNRVRVSAQLVDAKTGHHLWAHKYDRALDDIFQIQDEMTWQIVSAVEPHMETAELNRAAAKRSTSLSAWDYYLRARTAIHRLNPKDNAEARALYHKAIELDPEYSDAYAGLSLTY